MYGTVKTSSYLYFHNGMAMGDPEGFKRVVDYLPPEAQGLQIEFLTAGDPNMGVYFAGYNGGSLSRVFMMQNSMDPAPMVAQVAITDVGTVRNVKVASMMEAMIMTFTSANGLNQGRYFSPHDPGDPQGMLPDTLYVGKFTLPATATELYATMP
jgi:hypothetical protein